MELIKTPKVENVRMLDRFNNRKLSIGTLYLTTTHLIFVDPDNKKETWVLHMHVASVDKLPLTTAGSPLLIKCKTFLCVTFVIPKERDCHDIYLSLLQLAQPVNIEDLYCFHYTASNEDVKQTAGWSMFDLQSEFQRMGLPNENWCLTTINKEYEVCDTYPRYLHVPQSATTPILVGSSRFRSRGRFPVLTYLHKNQASITRCSQPLAGFSARCVEDEQMLNCILKANPSSNFMYVVDTRPRINAMANRAAGKGYENENFYENIKFQFLGIENIHVMRNSLQKLIEASELKVPSINAFISGIESSGWLRHIKSLFDTSVFIANAIEEGISVLVHCSDGWDRTAQTCSLASILLDPFFRTLAGFQALIEKEWLSFGHKFTDRCGFLQGDQKETSPVLTQFIDCIWQLMQQFPSAFQFNERFLLTLHDHVYSCQFGTFVGNCEKDRVDLRLNERSYSLWGFIANHMSEFVNPLYRRDTSSQSVLVPNLAPQVFKFWRGMYNRFENGVHPREPLTDLLSATKDHSSSLENHIKLLQKRIMLLKEMLGHADTPSKDIDSLMNDSGLAETSNMDPADSILAKYRDAECRLSYNSVQSDSESGVEDMRDGSATSPNYSSYKLQVSTEKGVVDGSHLVEQLTEELDSVAIDWKTFRNIRECICSTPFDYFSRKYHCWKCGEVFCVRCIDKHVPLPGHYGKNVVPVCRPCFKELKRSSSVES